MKITESAKLVRSLLEHLPYSAKPDKWVQDGKSWFCAEGPISGAVDEDFDQAHWTVLAKIGPAYRVVRSGTAKTVELAQAEVDKVIQRILSGGRE